MVSSKQANWVRHGVLWYSDLQNNPCYLGWLAYKHASRAINIDTFISIDKLLASKWLSLLSGLVFLSVISDLLKHVINTFNWFLHTNNNNNNKHNISECFLILDKLISMTSFFFSSSCNHVGISFSGTSLMWLVCQQRATWPQSKYCLYLM